MTEFKKRIFYFDELRAIAIFAVILCHVAGIYMLNPNLTSSIPNLLNDIGLIGVPLFFMISGALLLNKDYDLSNFLPKRVSRLLYPYIFWIFITILLGIIFFEYDIDLIRKLIFGHGMYTWFVWVMLGIYFFTPIINGFIIKYRISGCEYFLIFWFTTIILNTLSMYPFHMLELSYFGGFIGYFIFGYYLANKDFKTNAFTRILIGVLLFIIFTYATMYIASSGITLPGSAYLNIFVVLASAGVFITFKSISEYSEKNENAFISKIHSSIENSRIGSFIFSVSVCSYSMYFVHKIFTTWIASFKIDSIYYMPLIYIFVVVISWIISLICSKIPLIKEVSGVK